MSTYASLLTGSLYYNNLIYSQDMSSLFFVDASGWTYSAYFSYLHPSPLGVLQYNVLPILWHMLDIKIT